MSPSAGQESNPGLDALVRRGGLVKICGLREPQHAATAATAGADLIGFIFAPARRRVAPEQARACIEAARAAAPGPIVAVGVFVDEAPGRIAEVVEVAGLDAVQLSGAEPPAFAAGLPVPALKAIKPKPGDAEADVVVVIASHVTNGGAIAALVDGYHPGSAGGAGVAADWGLAGRLARRAPVLLAGGLDPENVAVAIRQVRPVGVDVSSGVEVGGVKDAERIAAFVSAAKGAFSGLADG